MDRLDQQDWMVSPESRAVLSALSGRGQDVRFVGGCVRDAVLRRPVRDIDLATPDPPETVMRLLDHAGLHVIPTGLQHGTVTAVSNHVAFEVTTLRLDCETDGRHARVAFTESWQADAARRDLTMNALSCRPDGQLFDYYGGLDDLSRGLVRFVGDPATRIREDGLRLLRYFRFFAHYGRGAHDGPALQACRELRQVIGKLSAERIRAEWLKILDAPDPVPALDTMEKIGVLAEFLPPERDFRALCHVLENQATFRFSDGLAPLVRLAALYVGTKSAQSLPERLRFSRREGDFFRAALAGVCSLQDLCQDPRLFFYQHDRDLAAAIILLSASRDEETERADVLLDQLTRFRKPPFPLHGRDLIASGFERGPQIGHTLRQVERWWVSQDFAPDRQSCLIHARQLVKAKG